MMKKCDIGWPILILNVIGCNLLKLLEFNIIIVEISSFINNANDEIVCLIYDDRTNLLYFFI
jgi:hypothetical protein